jgi:hypothetical protein
MASVPPHCRSLSVVWLALGWVGTGLLLASGCESSQVVHGSTDPGPAGPDVVVVGDWNDVEASVLVGASENEIAVVSSEHTNTEQRFHLRTIKDDLGTLIARRDHPASGSDSAAIPIHLTASIGPFGNPPLERSLLKSTKRRLESLAGVDFRPLR